MPPRVPQRERGFTLVEVLVALVVTALILGIVMNATLQAKTRAVTAKDRQAATILARSLIAGRAVAPFDAAPRRGEAGRLRWAVGERRIAADPRGMLALAEIDVAVNGPGGARLASLKLRKIKPVPRP
jgi:prepilin-type N-terminal cleavage/methylation domain-containing protein